MNIYLVFYGAHDSGVLAAYETLELAKAAYPNETWIFTRTNGINNDKQGSDFLYIHAVPFIKTPRTP